MIFKIKSSQSKLSIAIFLLIVLCSCGIANITQADEVPLAARLLAEPYSSTGVRVTISNLGSMYGLATDGSTAFAINSSGNVVSMPLAGLAALPGGSVTTTAGTVHTVGWGADGAPAWPNASTLSLSYSHGCLFITNNNNTLGQIHLYCIDVSDYSVTDIAVPGDKPLPAGYYYVISSLIDFPDGRIGKVSAETFSEAHDQYESTLRTYTLSGTGKSVSLTWSEDFIMGDPSYFAVDEHGIATDGTYLYRIQWRDFNPNTKVWALSGSSSASVVYSGQYTMPFDNMHFIAHNHTDSYYLIGHFSSNHFFITKVADPGPGPGHALVPAFETSTSVFGGYTTQISNYDPAFSWGVTTTAGTANLSETGLVTVSGLVEGASATTTVTATHSGFPNGSASVTGTALDVTAPTLLNATSTAITSSSAEITWDTDEAASTQAVFGLTPSYSSTTAETDTSPRATSHLIALSDLPSCTTYHYGTVSRDATGNTSTSTDATFTTLGCTASSTLLAVSSTAIIAENGGSISVTTSGGVFTVTAPENVTETSTSLVIQVKQISKDLVLSALGRPDNLPSEVGAIVFDVKAIINNTTILDSFAHPVTITYQYSDSDISGINESSIWLYHYHNDAWTPLDNCSVNTSANTISCTTPSFSIFAIFGQVAVAQSSSSGSGPVYGCTDRSAVNYNPSALRQSFAGQCQYATTTMTTNISQSIPTSAVGELACTDNLYLTKPVKFGAKNNPKDVKLLQKFLNTYENTNFQINGTYSKANFNAVVLWQEKYTADILKPWGIKKGTGYVYTTSLKKIKQLHSLACKK